MFGMEIGFEYPAQNKWKKKNCCYGYNSKFNPISMNRTLNMFKMFKMFTFIDCEQMNFLLFLPSTLSLFILEYVT